MLMLLQPWGFPSRTNTKIINTLFILLVYFDCDNFLFFFFCVCVCQNIPRNTTRSSYRGRDHYNSLRLLSQGKENEEGFIIKAEHANTYFREFWVKYPQNDAGLWKKTAQNIRTVLASETIYGSIWDASRTGYFQLASHTQNTMYTHKTQNRFKELESAI